MCVSAWPQDLCPRLLGEVVDSFIALWCVFQHLLGKSQGLSCKRGHRMCGTAAPAHATYWTLLTSGDLMACSPLGAGMGTVHSEGRRCLGQEEGPSAGPLGAVFACLRGAVLDVGKNRVTGYSNSHMVFRPLSLQRAVSACFFETVHLRREGGLSVSPGKVTVAILCCLKLTFSLFLK